MIQGNRTGRTNTLTVRTPEGIAFSMTLAGPVVRFLAWFVDSLILAAIMSFLMTAASYLIALAGNMGLAIAMLLVYVATTGYRIVFEWFWRGQTIGKKMLKIRVVDEQGMQVQFSQIVIRNLLRFIDALPTLYAVGGIACFASKKAQRLGDFAASTVVIRNPDCVQPDLDRVLPGKYNSFRDYPHLAARVRQQVSPDAATIALQALARRKSLNPEARVELFGELAEHFKGLAAFPEEAWDGMSDEQYVRNVLDIVYRSKEEAAKAVASAAE